MGTETANKIPRTFKEKALLNGVWRLKYKLVNRLGPDGFSGKLLSSYTDPMTGGPRHLYNEYGAQQAGYLIEREVTIFRPDSSVQDRNTLDWLIGHPSIGIEQSHEGLDSKYQKRKESNPRAILVNLDFQELEELEDEDYIDKLIGRISADSGVNSIGISTLRFVLSKLNLRYIEHKYITNPKVEKQMLRKSLKTFIRSGTDTSNAKGVNFILENLAEAKFHYEIKEMQRKEVIYISNGMFKFEGNPLATTIDGVIKHFTQHPDFYAELSKVLYAKLKEEKTKE